MNHVIPEAGADFRDGVLQLPQTPAGAVE